MIKRHSGLRSPAPAISGNRPPPPVPTRRCSVRKKSPVEFRNASLSLVALSGQIAYAVAHLISERLEAFDAFLQDCRCGPVPFAALRGARNSARLVHPEQFSRVYAIAAIIRPRRREAAVAHGAQYRALADGHLFGGFP